MRIVDIVQQTTLARIELYLTNIDMHIRRLYSHTASTPNAYAFHYFLVIYTPLYAPVNPYLKGET